MGKASKALHLARAMKSQATGINLDPDLATSAAQGRNVIINGDMQIAQRYPNLLTGLGATSGIHTLDRMFTTSVNSAGRFSMSQDSDCPNGFIHSLKYACTTADTSIAANEAVLLKYRIEGDDFQRFKWGTTEAQPSVFSFYVKGNAAATYTWEFSVGDYAIHKRFNVTTDWNRIVFAIPARFAGVVEQGEGKGGEWNFWLHAGSDYTGGTQVQDQWHTGYNNNQRANSSDTSFYDSTSRTFLITGIQWEIGSRVTPFEHLSYDEQLRRCQRYYFHTYFRHHYPDLATHRGAYNHNFGAMATYGEVNFFFPVSMRTTPTVTTYSPEGGQGAGSFQYWNGSSSVSTNSLYIGYHNQCHHNAKIALGSTSRSNFVGHVVAESEL